IWPNLHIEPICDLPLQKAVTRSVFDLPHTVTPPPPIDSYSHDLQITQLRVRFKIMSSLCLA
ncbi:hypothetical protein PENTCL1PPCAC_1197, partial [Pristionchus entomophagus]